MVDSNDGENEIAPFKNIMNEMYANEMYDLLIEQMKEAIREAH